MFLLDFLIKNLNIMFKIFRGLDDERNAIVSSGLRRVAVICKESTSSCAALAATGVIMKLLVGFKDILESQDSQYQGSFAYI